MANRTISHVCRMLRRPDVTLTQVREYLSPFGHDPETHNPVVREAWHIAERAFAKRSTPGRNRRAPGYGGHTSVDVSGLDMRRKLLQRQKALFRAYTDRARKLGRRWLRIGREPTAAAIAQEMQNRANAGGRAQWRRWYKANRQYQKQLRAYRHCGGKTHPKLAGLRRAIVP